MCLKSRRRPGGSSVSPHSSSSRISPSTPRRPSASSLDGPATEQAASSAVAHAGVQGSGEGTAGLFDPPTRRPAPLGMGSLASVTNSAGRVSRLVEPCPWCGFTTEALAIDGAVVMVLGIPSQYRELLAQFGSLAEIDNRLRYRYDAQSWTALERIAHVADVLHASAQCEVAILDGDRDRFVPVHVDAPRAGANAASSRVVLASLFAAAGDLGRAVSRVQPDDWCSRTRRGWPMSMCEVLENALHESHHHLGDVEDLLMRSCTKR
jgi:hypothetical protein